MKPCRNPRQAPRANSTGHGVVLLAVLIALAIGGIAAMAGVDVWSMSRQRDREEELLFVGDQYRMAIRHYYYSGPAGSPRVFPASLDELIEDKRFPIPVRHLRRLYADPMTGSAEWGAIRVADRIVGIHSLSEQLPVKQAGFKPLYSHFTGMTSYKDWVFIVLPPGASRNLPNAAVPPLPGATNPSHPVPRKPS